VDAVGGNAALPAATVNTAVSPAPAVRVVDAGGVAVAGVQVSFAVSAGGGAVAPAAATTDGDGVARVTSWTLGQQAGAQSLTATAAGVATPLVLTSTATAGAAANLAFTAGAGQSANVGTALPTRPAVRVTDAFGNPVAGAAVQFTPGAGSGTVAGEAQTTGADGTATVGTWTLGSQVGAQQLTATVGALTATLGATATVSGTPTITVQGGDAQQAAVGTLVATAPSVVVRDASGRPLGGVTVTFTPSGDGVVTGGTQTTNASGVATVGSWQLATTAGANVLTVRVTGVGSGEATAAAFATGTAGAATRVAIRAQPTRVQNPALPSGEVEPIDVKVQLEDTYGNLVSGSEVTVAAERVSGAGTIASGATTVTPTQTGIAVFTLRMSAPGTYTFRFSVPAQPALGTTAVSNAVTVGLTP
jgi:adhesin/invasin